MEIGSLEIVQEFIPGLVSFMSDVLTRIGNIQLFGIHIYSYVIVGAFVAIIAFFIHERG